MKNRQHPYKRKCGRKKKRDRMIDGQREGHTDVQRYKQKEKKKSIMIKIGQIKNVVEKHDKKSDGQTDKQTKK